MLSSQIGVESHEKPKKSSVPITSRSTSQLNFCQEKSFSQKTKLAAREKCFFFFVYKREILLWLGNSCCDFVLESGGWKIPHRKGISESQWLICRWFSLFLVARTKRKRKETRGEMRGKYFHATKNISTTKIP